MIAAVLNARDLWLVPYAPNVEQALRLGAKVRLDTLRALTGPSSRRPLQVALQCSLEWSAQITAAQFAQARNASQAAQDEVLLVPAWPFAVAAAAALPISSGLTLAWTRGFASIAINPGSFAGYDFKAPLLFGRFAQPPQLLGKNGEHVVAGFSFDEDAPAEYALVPLTAADTTAETASGYAAPVFPFLPAEAPNPGLAIVDVERNQQSAAGRIKSTTFYPQTPERMHEASFRFKTAAAAAQLLGWWSRRAGGADPHWVADGQAIGRLSADAAAGGNTLNFAAPLLPIGANRTLALFAPGVVEVIRAQTVASAAITTATNLAHTWPKLWTTVSLAFLARHTDEELVLNFRRADADWTADATLHWREVAPEYTPPAGETRGATLGRLPGAWWGFQIDLDYSGAVQTTRLTNWQSGATVGGHEWAYNDCDFSKLTQSIDLEDDECTFSLRWWPGCPLANWLPGQLAARGFVTVFTAEVSSAGEFSNLRQIWKGEIGRPKRTGPDYSLPLRGANALFSRKGPLQTVSKSCRTQLFSARCQLVRADWTFSATVAAVDGQTVTIGGIARTNGGGLPAGFGFVDWFGLGFLEWVSDGVPLRAGIASSSALAGGQIVLQVDRVLGFGVGATVLCVPECDKQGTTCRAWHAVTNPTGKFANFTHHRGFEFVPATAPGFVIPPRVTSPAKK